MKDDYGVVVCPKCRMARAVRLGQKTTACTRCGKKFEVKERRILYRAKDAREIGIAVAEINKKLMEK
ncbi:MAG: DUF1922 domain-containing protein [Candidatus Thermoplasmatota archaeon]|nr:DUF1922 domain-containing protein [Candidatus Thermoplasmatota archaeon]